MFNNNNSLFSNTNTTSIFTNNNNNNNNIFSNNNNNNNIFSNNNNTSSIFSNNTSIFANNNNSNFTFANNQNQQQQQSLFSANNQFSQLGNNNNIFNNNSNQYLNQLVNNQIISSCKATLTLQPSNILRYQKIGDMDENTKNLFTAIYKDLKTNQSNLAASEEILIRLENNFKVLNIQTQNTASYINMISLKNKKIQIILQNLRNELMKLNQSLEKEKNNFNILEKQESMNVNAPNDFLLYFVQELEDRLKSYSSQLNDIKALINLSNSEENGGFNFNSDMVEQLICELFKNVKYLLEKDAILNDKVNTIKNSYCNYLKKSGLKEVQINSRIEGFLKENEQNYI